VTLEKVEAFASEYRGSEEERGHVLDAYTEGGGKLSNPQIDICAATSHSQPLGHRGVQCTSDQCQLTTRSSPPWTHAVLYGVLHTPGDLDHVIDGVMCAFEADRARFRSIIDAALATGGVAPQGADVGRSLGGSPTGGKAKKAKKGTPKGGDAAAADDGAALKATVDKATEAKAKRRAAAAAKEAAEAEELLKEITARQQARSGGGGGGSMDLAALIKSRNSERSGNFDSWAAGLEAKYAPKPKAKGQKKSAK